MSDFNLLIIGKGGHARSVNEVCRSLGYISVMQEVYANSFHDSITDLCLGLSPQVRLKTILGVGDNFRRSLLHTELLKNPLLTSASVIDPSALISPQAIVSEGCVIMPRAVVGPGVVIGKNSIINTGAIIEHDSHLEEHVLIGPGAIICGGCSIGRYSFIGAGSVIIQECDIGANVMVGAGATVIKQIPSSTVAVGSPARVIRSRKLNESFF